MFASARAIRGFTLIEMMITISIAAILLTIAIPNLQGIVNENRITTQTNELVTDLIVTRSEAIRRGAGVTLCIRDTAGTDCDVAGAWRDGWLVFNDTNANGAVDTGETVIKVHDSLPDGMTITGFAPGLLTYFSSGAVGAGGAFTLCKPSYFGRVITITATGRPFTEKTAAACT